MPGLKLNIAICHDCGAAPFVINDTTDIIERYTFENFYCPKGSENIRSCEDIIKWCKDLLYNKFSPLLLCSLLPLLVCHKWLIYPLREF